MRPSCSLAVARVSQTRGAIGSVRCNLLFYGAGERSRTPDLLITNQLLYQLSYTGAGQSIDKGVGRNNLRCGVHRALGECRCRIRCLGCGRG